MFQDRSLQVVLEIHCHLVHQMDAVPAHHIVLCARVREVVHLDIVFDAFPYKAEAVLPYHHVVHGSLADEQLALQVLCLVDKAYLFISGAVFGRVSPG